MLKLLALLSKRLAAVKAFNLFSTPFDKVTSAKSLPEAENLQFTHKGLKISGHRWNHPQTKKIMILHGFGSAATRFQSFAAEYAKMGFEVLAFDAPAHGNSHGKRVNVLDYKDVVKEVMRLYGPVENFLAHSFGGLAISLALEETAHDEQTKVVLISPATETTTAIQSAFEFLQLKDEGVKTAFNQIIVEKSGHAPEWFSIRRAMNHIKAKVLWMHDEDDNITPWSDALKVKNDQHPNLHFMLTKGLGHRKIYSDSAVKKEIASFFAE